MGRFSVGPGLGTDRGHLVAEDPQARKHLLLLICRDGLQRPGAGGLSLREAEHLLVRLELELESPVSLRESLVFMLDRPQLLLSRLVLLLQAAHLLLQMHGTNVSLQVLRELRRDLVLVLLQQVDDDDQHEVNEVNSPLNDVLLGLGQALRRIPAGPFKKKVVDAVIQLPVELAQVLSAVSFGNPVLLPLIIQIARHLAALAFASAELLERRFAIDVPWRNQCHNLSIG